MELFSCFFISVIEVDCGRFEVAVGSIWSSSSKKIIVEPVTTFFTGSEWCAVVNRAFIYPASNKLGAIDSVTTFSTICERDVTVVDVSPSGPA